MNRIEAWPLACLLTLIPTIGAAETLSVGPGQKYVKPSQAIHAARDGDVVEIDSAGNYDNDVATIHAKNLTLRGVGKGRATVDAKGRHEAGKGIWVQSGDNLTVENIEFIGARCPDKNGAGIRGQAAGLTVRNCRFYDCENGILGGAGEVSIANSEFDHCGPVADPATHSCYFSEAVTKLTFCANYSTFVKEGHLLKSRARESWVMYNRLTDDNGTGSAVADFPNGGLVVLVGNLLHKGSKGHNDRVIAYGMEGIKHQRNGLYVINNTMLYEHRHQSYFVRVENAPPDLVPILRNNLCVGPIPLTNNSKADAAGNLILKTIAEAALVDPARFDFHLLATSPCIDKGVSPGSIGEISLVPDSQYVHPCGKEPRTVVGKLDVGAFEFRSPPERK